jgi:uncharacterized membrane protein
MFLCSEYPNMAAFHNYILPVILWLILYVNAMLAIQLGWTKQASSYQSFVFQALLISQLCLKPSRKERYLEQDLM